MITSSEDPSTLASLRLALSIVWTAGRRQMLVVIVGQVLLAGALTAQLATLARVLDRLISDPRAGVQAMLPLVALFAGLAIFSGLVTSATDICRDHLSELSNRYITDRLIDVANSVELARLEDPSFHDRFERASTSSDDQSWAVVWGLIGIASGIVGSIAITAYLLSVSLLLVGVIVVGAIPVFFASRTDGSEAYDFAYEMSANNRERAYIGRLLMERRAAAETRVFQSGAFLRRRFGVLYDERLGAVRALLRRRGRRSVITNLLSAIAIAVAALLIIDLTARGRVSVAQVAVAVAAIQQLAQRLSTTANGAANLHQASLFLHDFALLTAEPAHAQRAPDPAAAPSAIVLEELTFHYPGTMRAVLCDIDLQIPAGQVVALVGENGSGKTTLAKLLVGLYRPTTGRALWRDAHGVETDLADGKLRVAALFQDFLCYQLSAFDNVALGDAERYGDVAGVEGASDRAGITAEIVDLPFGWQTRLSREFENGSELSGGQWQRVAMARALFRDAPLLVLDEPTAALDARAERRLYEGLREVAAGRTVLFISHRFSSARRADRILVLKSGALIEDGTHDELMRAGGTYAELFTMQVDAYGLAD